MFLLWNLKLSKKQTRKTIQINIEVGEYETLHNHDLHY